MKPCPYCGRENEDKLIHCRECGTELKPTIQEVIPSAPTKRQPFFRWRAASVTLIALAILYSAVAFLNIWKGRRFSEHGYIEEARYLYWGTFWNFVVAVLCLGGRSLMKRQTSVSLLLGGIPVVFALLIVMRNWIGGMLTGRCPLPLFEVFVVWLPMLYVIIYAYRAK